MADPGTTQFYLPQSAWPLAELPESVEADPSIYFLDQAHCWVLQTYLRLRAASFPVRLTTELPQEGIVVSVSRLLPLDMVPGPRQLLVSISADLRPHCYAQMHVVQNRAQTRLLPDSYHIPLWPQAGAIPRDPSRGTRFERAAFFGDARENLAPELCSPSWCEKLSLLGVEFEVRDQRSPKRRDCSDVDLVVAVRSFHRQGFIRKPASKLYNAWIAGVPAVLGAEYAYQEERQSDLDYIEVKSVAQTLLAIRRLKEAPELRARIVENGRHRAAEVSGEALTSRWEVFLRSVALPRYEAWIQTSDSTKRLFVRKRDIQKKLRGLRDSMLGMLGRKHNRL